MLTEAARGSRAPWRTALRRLYQASCARLTDEEKFSAGGRVVETDFFVEGIPVTAHTADLIKTLASAAGDDPECFTAHGLRAGGATDLVARGATYAQLKAAGRWKSETCLRYFRSEEVVSRVVTELLGGKPGQRLLLDQAFDREEEGGDANAPRQS